ncbi:PREDICTED: uncharacterized protein LOC109193060 isoform X1 [Ipomoea nil]|uniref:uncharacterized protein LOC109193060 isoform X1 n=1 Tax=Ipomoea nil TaxID=35883 RepID=UPI0009013E99|nr:PREDICTED: uncharacterized protein LOC109193060 isoform X1 [Ipomoea nil]
MVSEPRSYAAVSTVAGVKQETLATTPIAQSLFLRFLSRIVPESVPQRNSINRSVPQRNSINRAHRSLNLDDLGISEQLNKLMSLLQSQAIERIIVTQCNNNADAPVRSTSPRIPQRNLGSEQRTSVADPQRKAIQGACPSFPVIQSPVQAISTVVPQRKEGARPSFALSGKARKPNSEIVREIDESETSSQSLSQKQIEQSSDSATVVESFDPKFVRRETKKSTAGEEMAPGVEPQKMWREITARNLLKVLNNFKFVLNEHSIRDLIVAADANASKLIRNIAAECGVALYEESKQVSYDVIRDENGNVKFDCSAIGKQFAAENISAQVVRKLVDDASKFLNDKVSKAVVTVPAFPFVAQFSSMMASNMAMFERACDFFFRHAAQLSGIPLRMVERGRRQFPLTKASNKVEEMLSGLLKQKVDGFFMLIEIVNWMVDDPPQGGNEYANEVIIFMETLVSTAPQILQVSILKRVMQDVGGNVMEQKSL